MLVNTLLRNVNRNMRTMQKKQDQLSTGKRVSAPSDDPVAITKILKYKTKINELEQYDTNAKDALSWTQTSELAITDVSNALNRMRELAVQAANETYSVEEREKVAQEIKQLKDHIIGNANKTFAGKHIFSSFQTDEKLLNEDGTFNINVTEKELTEKPTTVYEVGVGETIEVSTNGIELFGAVEDTSYFPTKVPTGTDEGSRATRASFIGENFDREIDHTGDTLSFSIDGTSYTVDMTNLDGSAIPITNEELKQVILKADDGGGNLLEDVATVTFNQNNDLVIETNTYGSGGTVTYDAASTDIFTTQNPGDSVTGVDLVEASVSGTAPTQTLTDPEILADTDERKFIVEYYGVTKEITVDMSLHSTVADLQTDMQNKLDAAFSDQFDTLNEIDPGANYGISVSGNPLVFETINSFPNGPVPTLNVRTIKSQQPTMMQVIDDFVIALESDETDGINTFLSDVDDQLENVNANRSAIGAKTNRLEMILSRIGDDSINVTQLLSNSQDVDMAETIMLLKNAENVYKASLSGGARVIQPSLLDFLR